MGILNLLQNHWAEVVELYLAIAVVVGAVGFVLEKAGKLLGLPWLAATGDKLESLSADMPKFFGRAKLASRALPPLLLVVLCLPVASSCAAAKPVARTVLDAARIMCARDQAERMGLSFDQAREAVCVGEQVLRPYMDDLLKQKARLRAADAGA